MKITQRNPKMKWDEIAGLSIPCGAVVTFPYSTGWKYEIMMRIWDSNRKVCRLVRLDGETKPADASNIRCGATFTLTPEMVARSERVGNPKEYWARIHNKATLYLEGG